MYTAIGLPYVDLDDFGLIEISSNSTIYMIKTSNPVTGFMWYLLSEDENKIKVEDVDGMYIIGKPGYQNFTVSCSIRCKNGDSLKLSLILKRPWENNLSVMKSIDLIVVEKNNQHL